MKLCLLIFITNNETINDDSVPKPLHSLHISIQPFLQAHTMIAIEYRTDYKRATAVGIVHLNHNSVPTKSRN